MRHSVAVCILAASMALAETIVAQQPPVQPSVRRVITTLDNTGKAIVMADGPVALRPERSRNPVGDLWITDKSPADFSWTTDRAAKPVGLTPPLNGTIFRVVDFPPVTPDMDKLDVNTMMKVVGDHAPKRGLPPKHPMMHRTRSLDYALVMSGEIDMMLDQDTVHLKAGDVVIQQATNHAWINRGKVPARVAFILIDSQEP